MDSNIKNYILLSDNDPVRILDILELHILYTQLLMEKPITNTEYKAVLFTKRNSTQPQEEYIIKKIIENIK